MKDLLSIRQEIKLIETDYKNITMARVFGCSLISDVINETIEHGHTSYE